MKNKPKLNYSDTDYPVNSEVVEPAMAHIIGCLFMQVEEETDEDAILTACGNLWYAAKSIDRLGSACNKKTGAVHFSIASGAEKNRIATYIEKKVGFNPWFGKEDEPLYDYFNSIP